VGGKSKHAGKLPADPLPAIAAAGYQIRRQANTRFAFSPWRRATSATDAPGRIASSTIRRFSSGDHLRRDRLPMVPLNLHTANGQPNASNLPVSWRDNVH
jgi:hypothetical protein